MEIEAGLLELYRDPALDEKPKLLEERGGAFYSEAAAALVASLHAGTGDVQVVNVRNARRDPRTCPTTTSSRSPRASIATAPTRSRRRRSRRRCSGIVQHAKAYERLAIEAATTGDRTMALKALIATRWSATTRAPLHCWMRCSRRTAPFLPRFFPDG